MPACLREEPGTPPPVYRPRHPEKTTLYQVVSGHWPRLKARWDEDFEPSYGPLRSIVAKTFDGYLDCGILDRGFARLRCDSCKYEALLAFSCKTRGVCPSCGKKRQILFSRFVADEVLEPVPHRQVVFTVPKRLRVYFATDRRRLARLARAGYLTLRQTLRKATGQLRGQPGSIIAIQTFGSLLDFHPHLHCLVTWGVFAPEGGFCEPQLGSHASSEQLQLAFRERVFKLLLADGAIDLDVVENMRSWQHSGFAAHVGTAVNVPQGIDTKVVAPDALLSYFVRPPISLVRLRLEPDGKVSYKADRVHPKHKASVRMFEPLDFLGLLAMHIPDPNNRLVAYSGFYSNRVRGERKKREQPTEDLGPPLAKAPAEPLPPVSPSRSRSRWARLIAFVWEADPLSCPHCPGELEVVAIITSHVVVVKILNHVRGRDPPANRDPTATHVPQARDVTGTSREPFHDDLPWGESVD